MKTFLGIFSSLAVALSAAAQSHNHSGGHGTNRSPAHAHAAAADEGCECHESEPMAGSDAAEILDPLVVTSVRAGSRPLTVVSSLRAPAQPIPAQDGADSLKTIAGISVGRKGGAGGEVTLRGQAGSRLDLLLDGQSVLGGCPNRMDPPTAYVFPRAFDRVTVLKGPQSVLYGPGNSAGVVLFEREPRHYAQRTIEAEAVATMGSFGRRDGTLNVRAGESWGYGELALNHTRAADYEDGDGRRVHSQYERASLQAALGWTPDEQTLVELSGNLGQGEAAYGHGGMDATKLDRENLSLRVERRNLTERVSRVEAQVAYNSADHIMDNFRLRLPGMMAMESRPGHQVWSGRVLGELALGESLGLSLGGDFRDGRHRSHDTGTWVDDATAESAGLFGEAEKAFGPRSRVVLGGRVDTWRARDRRQVLSGGMMGGGAVLNPTANQKRRSTLGAGFLRYEHGEQDAAGLTSYAGIGYTERAPDYWELIRHESLGSRSAFGTHSEKTAQLDLGLNYTSGDFRAFAAVFANRVDDFILLQNGVQKGMRTVTAVRSVDAESWGGEAGLGYTWAERWQADASLAAVRGRNRSDGTPLAQQPPLEGRLSLTYAAPKWSVGGLARFVAAQNRVAAGQGTIAGQDIGATPGFAVYSLNAGWRVTEWATLTAGVDNVFDKTYAEHLSRAGATVAGYPTTTRINEPGRTLWASLNLSF